MAVSTEHLADDITTLREANRQLALDIRDLASGQSAVQTEFRLAWRIGTGLAVLTLPMLGGLIWQAGALTTEVRLNNVNFEKRLDKFEQQTDQRFDKVDQRFDKVDQRFDKVDQRIERLEQKTERLEQKIDQRFDQVMQRLEQIVPKAKP